MNTNNEKEKMNPERLSQIHHTLSEKAFELLLTKNEDYSSKGTFDNFKSSRMLGIHPVRGILVRLLDKVARINSFIDNGRLNHEGVEDSVVDIINYSVLAFAMLEGKKLLCVQDELGGMAESLPHNIFVLCKDYFRFQQLSRENGWKESNTEYHFVRDAETIIGRNLSDIFMDVTTMQQRNDWYRIEAILNILK